MHVKRLLELPHDHSVLLFGARGVGKSSLLEGEFNLNKNLYDDSDLKALLNIACDFENCEPDCFSCDSQIKKIEGVMIYPWQDGIKKFFVG